MHNLKSRIIILTITTLIAISIILASKYPTTHQKPPSTPYAFLGAYAEYNFTSYDKIDLYKLNATRVSGIRRYEIVSVNPAEEKVTVRITMEKLTIKYRNGTTTTYTNYSEIAWKVPVPYVCFYEEEVSIDDVIYLMPWIPPNKLGMEEINHRFKLIGIADVTTPIGKYPTYIYKLLEKEAPIHIYFDMETGLAVKMCDTGEVKYLNMTATIISTNILKHSRITLRNRET